jgi:hypothetical protein
MCSFQPSIRLLSRAQRVPEAVAKARAFAAAALPLLEQLESLAAKAAQEGDALDAVFREKTLMNGASWQAVLDHFKPALREAFSTATDK